VLSFILLVVRQAQAEAKPPAMPLAPHRLT